MDQAALALLKESLKQPLTCIGILTSGGDAPGMNAAIRSVTRAAIHHGLRVKGVRYGYRGLYEGNRPGATEEEKNIVELKAGSVGDIVHRGGTMLHSARLPEFKNPDIRTQAAYNALKEGIQALVVLGGDGSFFGAHLLASEHGIPVIGIPCTIDNDLRYSDVTIGFDTAVNTAVNAINELRDTMNSHDRISIVEVMGRNCGDIAIQAGVAAGAEAILVPEVKKSDEAWINHIVTKLEMSRRRNKRYGIIVVAEGCTRHSQTPSEVQKAVGETLRLIDRGADGAVVRERLVQVLADLKINEFTPDSIAQDLKKRMPDIDARGTVLGHTQRGGSPSASDRILASRLGLMAVEQLLNGCRAHAVGIKGGQLICRPIPEAIAVKRRRLSQREMIRLAEILAM